MKKYKVITIGVNEDHEINMLEVNKFLDEGCRVQETRITSSASAGSYSSRYYAWPTVVLFKEA